MSTSPEPTTSAPTITSTAAPAAVGGSEHLTIAERMNQWRVALTNATAQPEIAAALTQDGLTAEIVAEGISLHDEASR